jgi:hypothetical protein
MTTPCSLGTTNLGLKGGLSNLEFTTSLSYQIMLAVEIITSVESGYSEVSTSRYDNLPY